MEMIRPITVDETVMTSTNVPEDDAPEWSSGSAPYAEGDRVIKTSTHLLYESLTNNNSDDPEDGINESPKTWAIVSATRPWRMFDQKRMSVAQALEPMNPVQYTAQDNRPTLALDFVNQEYQIAVMDGIALTFEPGELVDSIALLNISGVTAHVIVETSQGIVYESRTPISGGLEDSNWHAYFYSPIDRRKQLILSGLPMSLDAKIHIAIEEISSPAQIGEVVVGRSINLGCLKYGASPSIIDYSKKERDEFGNLVIVERRYTKLIDYRVSMDRRITDAVFDALAEVRATPTLFIGTTEHPSMNVFGIYRDMRITLENYALSEATIEVEEV